MAFAALCNIDVASAQYGNTAHNGVEYEYPSAWKFSESRRPQVQAEERVVALKRFSLELYKTLIDDESNNNENVVCSPWSVAMALTMLHDGANKHTAKEIRKALHFQGNSKYFEKYLHMVAYNARAKKKRAITSAPLILESANSFWTQSGYDFRAEYYDLLNDRFLAGLFPVDFSDNPSEAAEEINDWCSENTREQIKKIIDVSDIAPQQRMMLLNAVYFKARWISVFSHSETKTEWFHHADGTVSHTKMMNITGEGKHYQYYEGDGFKALKMGYCGNAHMLILLPDEVDGLAKLESKLTLKTLRQIDNQSKGDHFRVKLPRFAFDTDSELISAMQKLGVNSAFDTAQADFSKMTDEKGFFINLFRQKAIIQVDEEGTVAAAVSGGGAIGGRPPEPKTFYADRPFMFLIRENTDNSILFMGRVHHPEKAEDEPIEDDPIRN
jgi:Serine protease inhibitor